MVLCPDNMRPLWMAILLTRRRLHCRASCTSAKHLLVPLQQKNIVGMHHFGLVSWWMQCRHNIGSCVHGSSKEDDENQCDTMILHHALDSLIGINKN